LRLTVVGLAAPCALLLMLIVPLRWLAPATTAFMLTSPVKPVDYRWVPITRIAPAAALAVVAAEDQKFPFHHGFDLQAIDAALAHNARSRRVRGASTISQQTAKNLFLWSGRSYLRKGFEALLTVALEHCWNKRRILEIYLNIVEFGPGVYGVEAAAQRYFHAPAARLSPHDAALLAAVLPNPRALHVAAPSRYVETRAAEIEQQMRQLGANYLAALD
jgi:monofunctional biosynthetic peptidoglycan transglycosylase